MRVAAVDIGSNSTRLLIAEVVDGAVLEIERRSTVTRLGEGVDGSQTLAPQAIDRVLAALREYHDEVLARDVVAARAVMTSAVRDASNGEAFRAQVADEFGYEARILTGDEEAQLTFAGAMSERPADDTTCRVVIDVGGGSTELIVGAGHEAGFHVSTQVGVVRHSERHLHHDPPTADEVASLARDARAAFDDVLDAGARAGVRDAVSVAGTATSCAAILQELEPYDSVQVEGYRLTLDELDELARRLAGMRERERRELPGLHPDRAATIVAGAIILAEALRAFGRDSTEVSEHDLLRGIALELGTW